MSLENENINRWNEVTNKLLSNEAVVETVSGNSMTVCRYTINKKINIPIHSHEYEQIIYMLQGKMKLIINNEEIYMKPGDIQVILSNIEHSAEIIEAPFQSIESYDPVRTDLLYK